MISVKVALDGEGVLKNCSVRGHSSFAPRGGDIVCAAVSVLTRTAARLLSRKEGILFSSSAEKRGEVEFSVSYEGEEAREFLRVAGLFFIEGVRSVAEEHPENCSFELGEI